MEQTSILNKRYKALPNTLKSVLEQFCKRYQASGWECFLVGGSCRDLLLGEEPKDFDFATNCPLEESQRLFKKVIPTGALHGTLTILFKGLQFEVTRYRKDVETDGRRAVVEFSDSIEEDLKRRDLRINAIAFDVVSGAVVDSENGLVDFQSKMIRFVGDPVERVMEDHLRAIRYIRFIAKLSPFGFSFNPKEMDAVISSFKGDALAIERIYDELYKMFKIKNRDNSFLAGSLAQLKLFQSFLPSKRVRYAVLSGILASESLLPLAFTYGQDKTVKEVVVDLKLTRAIKRLLSVLVRFQGVRPDDTIEMKRFMSQISPEDLKGEEEALDWIMGGGFSKKIEDILKANVPYRIGDLKISGKDLKLLGIQGKKVGETFAFLLEHIWIDPSLNCHSTLLQIAEEFRLFPSDPVHPLKTLNKEGL